jgi:hypothetical protein
MLLLSRVEKAISGKSNQEEESQSRRMRWAGTKYTRFWWESPTERDHSEDRGVDGKMGSECILGRLAGGGVDSVSSG